MNSVFMIEETKIINTQISLSWYTGYRNRQKMQTINSHTVVTMALHKTIRQKNSILSSGIWKSFPNSENTAAWNNSPIASSKTPMPPQRKISVRRMSVHFVGVFHSLPVPSQHFPVIPLTQYQDLWIKDQAFHLLKQKHFIRYFYLLIRITYLSKCLFCNNIQLQSNLCWRLSLNNDLLSVKTTILVSNNQLSSIVWPLNKDHHSTKTTIGPSHKWTLQTGSTVFMLLIICFGCHGSRSPHHWPK